MSTHKIHPQSPTTGPRPCPICGRTFSTSIPNDYAPTYTKRVRYQGPDACTCPLHDVIAADYATGPSIMVCRVNEQV